MADANAPSTARGAGVSLVETPLALSMLRVRAPDDGSIAALGAAFGMSWPAAPNLIAGDSPRVACLAPGEWAIFAAGAPVAEKIAGACGNRLHHVADVSAGLRLWRIAGPHAATMIAKGCSLDLHPRVLGPGRCAQTLLAQVPVVLIPEEGGQAFEIVADASLAGHLRAWFADAGWEYVTD